MKKEIYFVTSNKSKWEEYSNRFKEKGYTLIQSEENLEEGRSMDIRDIVMLKIEQAKKKFPGKKILVDDRGFFIDALNGFPGPYVKLMLNTIGYKGISKIMAGDSNRKACFLTGVGYFDGKDTQCYVEEEVGFITNTVRGKNIRGWTDILKIYGYAPISSKKSLAEYTDRKWSNYLKLVGQEDQVQKLLNTL